MLIRLLSLIAFVAVGAFAQRSDTVSFRLFTNETTVVVSPLIRNIGQSQHLFFLQLSDDGVSTCTAFAGEYAFFLEGSFDNVTYTPISTQNLILGTGATPSTFEGVGFANGAFPFLRARSLTNAPVGCKMNAWYTGTIPTAPFPQLPRAASAGYINAHLRVSGPGSFAFSFLVSGKQRVIIYGLFVYNTAATPNDVELTFGNIDCSTKSGLIIDLKGMQGFDKVTWPTSLVPYAIGAESKQACLHLSAATAVNATIIYRLE